MDTVYLKLILTHSVAVGNSVHCEDGRKKMSFFFYGEREEVVIKMTTKDNKMIQKEYKDRYDRIVTAIYCEC